MSPPQLRSTCRRRKLFADQQTRVATVNKNAVSNDASCQRAYRCSC